ncbi:MAG: hypothetical protein E6R03_18200 [Hyphomicrobiaceae bacterium]|nr:MAG: hypothetical protein E6R03_18200 [Hyphomicrobiaceae bacterium]
MMRFAFALKTKTFFDDPPAVPPVVPPVVPPPPPTPQTFTQEQVNAMLAKNKRELQTKNEELATQLEALKQKTGLSEQEKADLESRIEQLRTEHLSESQQLQRKAAELEKKLKTDSETLSKERDSWKGRFDSTLIENGIRAGSVKHTAASDEQMIALYGHKARVVEILDDAGQPTGMFEVRLKVKQEDPKTKKDVEVELPIVDAIGELRKRPENANLFLTDGKPGAGLLNGNADKKQGSTWRPGMSQEEYNKSRKNAGLAK